MAKIRSMTSEGTKKESRNNKSILRMAFLSLENFLTSIEYRLHSSIFPNNSLCYPAHGIIEPFYDWWWFFQTFDDIAG